MKFAALTGGVILGAVWFWWYLHSRFAHRDQPVSDQWLADQERTAQSKGIDSVAWEWPVNKAQNEQGWRNRQRERKRA
jgi:hypothetical protein